MKTKIFSIVSIIALALCVSCEPTEVRVPLENSYDPSVPLDIQVTQTGNKGNGITLKVLTPGVYGMWDFGVGTKLSDEVSFTYIATGEATFTFYVYNQVTSKDEKGTLVVQNGFKQEVKVQIDEIDQELPENYGSLCGSDLAAGKTWVLNGGAGSPLYWYMCPAGDPSKWQEAWWDAGECCPPADVAGKMHFDLDGGANYSYYESESATPTKGKFAFNPDFTELSISGANILGYDETRVSPDNKYKIIELTEDKLVLYAMTNGGGTGWIWVYKAL